MKRRHWLAIGLGAASIPPLLRYFENSETIATEVKKGKTFEITKTEEEWKKILTPQQFRVLRLENTEAPGSSPLDREYGKGIYHCAGCDLPLFTSATKFNSKTGWPSFYAPMENAVEQREDGLFALERTEVHCRRCGGHMGHVFDDGPKPTGLRYCMNGVSLKFIRA
jgi:peptide-methionine (R)-S-oxide reductase